VGERGCGDGDGEEKYMVSGEFLVIERGVERKKRGGGREGEREQDPRAIPVRQGTFAVVEDMSCVKHLLAA